MGRKNWEYFCCLSNQLLEQETGEETVQNVQSVQIVQNVKIVWVTLTEILWGGDINLFLTTEPIISKTLFTIQERVDQKTYVKF